MNLLPDVIERGAMRENAQRIVDFLEHKEGKNLPDERIMKDILDVAEDTVDMNRSQVLHMIQDQPWKTAPQLMRTAGAILGARAGRTVYKSDNEVESLLTHKLREYRSHGFHPPMSYIEAMYFALNTTPPNLS